MRRSKPSTMTMLTLLVFIAGCGGEGGRYWNPVTGRPMDSGGSLKEPQKCRGFIDISGYNGFTETRNEYNCGDGDCTVCCKVCHDASKICEESCASCDEVCVMPVLERPTTPLARDAVCYRGWTPCAEGLRCRPAMAGLSALRCLPPGLEDDGCFTDADCAPDFECQDTFAGVCRRKRSSSTVILFP